MGEEVKNMKKHIFDSRKPVEISFNMNGLFCPLSFTVLFDDGSSKWILPDKPKNGETWTYEELDAFVNKVVSEYNLHEYVKDIKEQLKKL